MDSAKFFLEMVQWLSVGWTGLPDKPDETPESTIEVLWQYVSESDVKNGEPLLELTTKQQTQLRTLVEKRIGGVPLAYLIGKQEFMGIKLLASSDAMIPRKETIILGQLVLDTAKIISDDQSNFYMVDLCTGSGNIALLVASHYQNAKIVASDLSENAVKLAQQNKDILGINDRVRLFQGDLFGPFENPEFFNQFDLVTCNPPYISSTQVEKLPQEIAHYEPRLAFDGGSFGVSILTRLVREAPRFLKPGGYLCFEVGTGQGKVMQQLVQRTGLFDDIHLRTDDDGEIRAIRAHRIIN
jgi:release factor glutamine methyltransferase